MLIQKKDRSHGKVLFLSPGKGAIFIVFFTLVFTIGISFFVYTREARIEKTALMKNERFRVNAIREHIHGTLYAIASDLRIATTYNNLRDYLETGDSKFLTLLTNEYLLMSRSKNIYDQIRLLDETGMEKIRINYNSGNPSIVADENLQNKKDRYYFEKTSKLNPNQIFLSPFDLNIEQNKIEEPRKPMIRIGTPLFNRAGEKKGIVLLNYLGNDLLESMNRFYQKGNGTLLLINQDGYWIKGFSPEDEWGFLYPEKNNKNIQESHPQLWEAIYKENDGQLETAEGLFTFSRIHPLSDVSINEYKKNTEDSFLMDEQYAWIAISFISKNEMTKTANALLEQLFYIDTIFLLIITVLSWRLGVVMKYRKRAEKTILELNDLLRVVNKMLRHDILGKLGSIRICLEASEQVEKNEMVTEAYQKTQEGIELVNNVREIEGSLFVQKSLEKYNVQQVIEKIAREQKMKVKLNGNATVIADSALYSVFENIIRNARIHAGVSSLTVDIEKQEGKVVLRIADRGKGVEKSIQDSLFQEGVKSSTTGNTGIGLFVVKKTIDRYGGSIRAESNRPQGTVFIIELPT